MDDNDRGKTAPTATLAPAQGPRPLRSDARRTRRALLDGAREVFERDGYVNARIADIAKAAGVAHGSFYSHFDGKEQALEAVLAEVSEEMLHPGPALSAGDADPAQTIEAANRAYLQAYRRNVRLMAVLEQVATVDERFRKLRLKRTDAFVRRNATMIERLQSEGMADRSLDQKLAAMALSAMVSRTAYFAFAVGRRVDFEELVATLTSLWVNGLGIGATRLTSRPHATATRAQTPASSAGRRSDAGRA